MPKPNQNSSGAKGGDIKIKVEKSSIAEFTKREVPTAKEVKEFEDMVEESSAERLLEDHEDDVSDEEIEESLNEIYQDSGGETVNVRRLDIKKKHGLIFWFLSILIIGGSLFGSGYAAYYFYQKGGADATAVTFTISGETEVRLGEEFFYTLEFNNESNVNIGKSVIKATYPDNFVFLDSFPASDDADSLWRIDAIPAKSVDKITIKGMMIGPLDDAGIILAQLSYLPENFSSEFKKEASLTTTINDLGLEIDFDYIKSALIGEEQEIIVNYRTRENSNVNKFRLQLEPQENIEIIANKEAEREPAEGQASVSLVRPGVWQIANIGEEERELPLKIVFKKKVSENQEVAINFAFDAGGSNYINFLSKKLAFEVMKSDLNLTMIINGDRDDQGVEFGETLQYSIVYSNRGETEMKDVVIMAILDSEFLDWASLEDGLNGKEKGNTISWSKEEIAGLEVLDINEEGTIDFSIKVSERKEIDPAKEYQIKSFAQYSIGDAASAPTDSDNRSNTIINKINSDLDLSVQVRYFSEDNIPVGTGPHPPKVGETTSYKVYWQLTNSLHELDDLIIKVKLPEYVIWSAKQQAAVGTLRYQASDNAVIWNIGRLPITVYKTNAEFSISITPTAEDKNTIMVLLPETTATAVDTETEADISISAIGKTSKLEDDDIAVGDGIVE